MKIYKFEKTIRFFGSKINEVFGTISPDLILLCPKSTFGIVSIDLLVAESEYVVFNRDSVAVTI